VTVDLAAALATALPAPSPPTTREVRVEVTALSPGLLTVYPPEIVLED
jgi:hypothetical protein